MNLSNLAMAELKTLQHQVADEIKKREGAEIRDARERILAIAQSAGISKDDLKAMAGAKVATSRAPSSKTYKNPANSENVWRGRGPHPSWLKDLLKSGTKLEELAESTQG